MNRERYLERARIAFGIDPRPRAQALKAWHARWDGTQRPTARQYGGGYVKVAGPAQLATKAASMPARRSFEEFDALVEECTANNGVVRLAFDGRTLTASGFEVKAIAGAGVDWQGEPLVALTTAIGRSVVRRSEIRRKG